MKKIAIKTIDGVVYSGEIVERTSNILKLKNLKYYNVTVNSEVPNLAHSEGKYYYPGEVVFFLDKIIWYSEQQ